MRSLVVNSLWIILLLQTMTQAQKLDWAVAIGGTDLNNGDGIAYSNDDGVYIVGTYRGIVDFDPGPGVVELLANDADEFILKLDLDGNYKWVHRINGIASCDKVIADDSGNVYVAGGFASDNFPIYFNGRDPEGTRYSKGANDGFILKLDPEGNFKWVGQIEGAGFNRILDMEMDPEGNIWLFGHTEAFEADLDPGPGIDLYGNDELGYLFLVKINPAGDLIDRFVFAEHPFRIINDFYFPVYPNSVDIGADGTILLSGDFFDEVELDPGPGLQILSGEPGLNAFLVQLDPNGIYQWSKGVTNKEVYGKSNVICDKTGDIYLCMSFRNSLELLPNSIQPLLTSFDQTDVAILKFKPSGELIWAHQFGGPGDINARDMTLGSADDIIVVGDFSEWATLDPVEPFDVVFSEGREDIFIISLSKLGTLNWQGSQGMAYSDRAFAVAADQNKGIYITGTFEYITEVDPTLGLQVFLYSNGPRDILITRLEDLTVSVTRHPGDGMEIYPNPNNGRFFIKIDHPAEIMVSVYNSSGQLMYSGLVSGQKEIELSGPSGIYYLKAETNNTSYTKPLFVE